MNEDARSANQPADSVGRRVRRRSRKAWGLPGGSGRRSVITGLRLRSGGLEWTTLREGRGHWEIVARGGGRLEADPEAWQDAARLAAEIHRQFPGLQGVVSLGLGSEKMFLRVVDLPSTDADEMAAMVRLQADKFSPYADENLALSHEPLRAIAGGCQALIAGAQKETVEFAGAVLRQAGLNPQRMDAEAMGWWRVLADAGRVPAAGRVLILLLEDDGGLLFAAQDGALAALRAIPTLAGCSGEEYAAEISHEIGAFILGLDLELGAAPVAGLEIWRAAAPDADSLTARVQSELGLAASVHDLASLPPASEGLARRMLRPPFGVAGAPPALNLAPPEWRAAETALYLKRRLAVVSALVLGAWVVAALVFTAGYLRNERGLRSLEERLGQRRRAAEEVRAMQKQAGVFEQHLDRKYSVLESLRTICQVLPEGVHLTALQFKKGRTLILRAEALDVNPIYDFKQALDRSEFFPQIELGSIQPSKRKEQTVQTFHLTIRLPESQP